MIILIFVFLSCLVSFSALLPPMSLFFRTFLILSSIVNLLPIIPTLNRGFDQPPLLQSLLMQHHLVTLFSTLCLSKNNYKLVGNTAFLLKESSTILKLFAHAYTFSEYFSITIKLLQPILRFLIYTGHIFALLILNHLLPSLTNSRLFLLTYPLPFMNSFSQEISIVISITRPTNNLFFSCHYLLALTFPSTFSFQCIHMSLLASFNHPINQSINKIYIALIKLYCLQFN